jgi:hypothetical protein
MVALPCIMAADDTDGWYKLFPIQLQYPFTSLHILQHMTQALIVQCIRLCSVILVTQNNSVPCSVGHIWKHLWGDTIKSTSHCLFKVIRDLVAPLCNDLLYISAGVTRYCGHPVQSKDRMVSKRSQMHLPSTILNYSRYTRIYLKRLRKRT